MSCLLLPFSFRHYHRKARRLFAQQFVQQCVVFLAVVFLCGIALEEHLAAQSLSISGLDISGFPRIRASVRAFDANGNRITSSAGMTLTENGVPRAITSFSCPMVQPQPFSAVLTIDVSGSMGVPLRQGNALPIDIAKAAANAFIESVPNDGSECAITAFETRSYIITYFSNDRPYLQSAVNSLFPMQGTNYQDAFLNPISGALAMAGRAKQQKRAIIFLTDGLSNASANLIVEQALALNARVYCITIGLPTPNVLKEIVNRTGGAYYENVFSQQAAVHIYRELANTLSIDAPCAIEWTSEPACNTNDREIALTHAQLPMITARDRYAPPFALASLISMMPRGLAMGAVPVGMQHSQTLTLTLNADTQPVQVHNIRSSDPAFRVSPSMFLLQPGQPQELNVTYTAPDSGYKFASFRLEIGNGCNVEFYATAGFPGVRPRAGNPDTLLLLHPNGDEEFLVGSDTVITWKGVPPDEPVKLEYSIDAGKTWTVIDTAATGLRYRWRVPNTPSTQCIMRVVQKNTSLDAFSNDSLIVLYQNPSRPEWGTHNNNAGGRRGSVLSARFDKGAHSNELVTTGADGKARLWNAWTGKPSARVFDLDVRTENGDALDVDFNLKGEIGVIFDGISFNAFLMPSQWPDGFALNARLNRGNAPLRAIRFNPLVPDQFVITPGDPQMPVMVYNVSNLGVQGGRVQQEYTIENSQGGVRIANFTPDGQGIYAAADRNVRLWDVRQQGPFRIFEESRWEAPFGTLVLYADAHLSPTGLIVAATCSDNSIRFLRVSAADKGKLEEFNRINAPAGVTALEKTTFNRTGQYMVSTAVLNGTGIGLLWDMNNTAHPLPLFNKGRHGAKVNTAFFSNDEPVTRVATSSEDGTAIIWFIREKLPLQQDESDRLWSIVRPSLQPLVVDMKRAVVGGAKDSVTAVVINPTKWEVPIVHAFIRSRRAGEASPFSVVSGGAPFAVGTGATAWIEFRFAPLRAGFVADDLVLITVSGDTLVTEIRGEGIVPSLTSINVHFGSVFVGAYRDTVISAIFTNTGQTNLTLINPQILGPGGVFRLGAGFPIMALIPAGRSVSLPLRFEPRFEGQADGVLSVKVLETNELTTATLTGIGLQDGAYLQAQSLSASPQMRVCDTTSFLIMLQNSGNKELIIPATGATLRGLNGAATQEFAILTNFPLTIPAGSTGAIVMRFQPGRIGTARGLLTLSSNSLGGDVAVNLIAQNERDSLVFSDRFLILPPVESGETTSTTFTVRNIGNAGRDAWFAAPQALYAPDSRFRISAMPALPILSSGATSQVQISFMGGEAGRTYQDFFVFNSLCPTGAGRSDTVRVSVTVQSRPALRLLSSPTPVTTCDSSGVLAVEVMNVGTSDARIDAITLAEPFRVRNVPSSVLQPRDTVRLEIEYRLPTSASGTFPAVLRIEGSSAGTLTADLSVRREFVGFSIAPRVLMFPRLEAHTPASTTITITNTGSVPLDLTAAFARQAGDRELSFATSDGSTPIQGVLAPQSSREILVRFSGGAGNQTFSSIVPFEQVFLSGNVAYCHRYDTLRVEASTIGRTGELVFTDIKGAPGEQVSLYVFLRNRTNIPIGTVISDTLRTNVTMLYPQSPTPRGYQERDAQGYGERVIPLQMEVRSENENIPLDTLRFLVLLGNDSLAAMRLQGTPQSRSAGMLITTASPGTETCRTVEETPFVLTGTTVAHFCLMFLPYQGRGLVSTSLGTVSIIDLKPQPVSAEMTIDFWSRDAELYVLRLSDARGQEMFPPKQIQAVRGMNTITITETLALPRGSYFVSMRNSRELVTRQFMIAR